jgi:hypothetical protein
MARRAFAVASLLYLTLTGCGALVWPARVPLHFDARLRADAYVGRGVAALWAIGLGLFMIAVFAGCARLARRVPLATVNVPHAAYWKAPEQEAELRRRLAEDSHHVGAATLLMLSGILGFVTDVALNGSGRLPWPTAVLIVGYVAYLTGWTAWLLLRRYRPPDHPRSGEA